VRANLPWNLANFLRFFFRGLGANIFSPLDRVAKVLIPKSMPIELLVLGKYPANVSTIKLRKYLLAESLITVSELGSQGNFLDQITFNFPI
jgi:hypothetical protein